ncbi:type IV secretion system protein [Serratia symbiotica]|uniref:type IV secretion system protein n=1 Tax=Serratia symbiotica TaxID=138074 RepID=UPI00135F7471|nr:type IV secretion system protein [Serratia symbiotica]MBQ0957299.1 conjugal transfer protein [Serratia symbiotica]
MTLKRTLVALGLALVFAASTITPTLAGVPTVDIPALRQMLQNAQQQAREALAQLDKAKEAISQAKSQYEHYKGIVQGNDKLGEFLNDPYVNQLLPAKEWQDIYTQAKDLPQLRQRYGLVSDNPQVQAAFDKLLSQADVLEKQYKATNTRLEHAKGLRNRLNSVETPKEREQLALRYQQENLELQSQQVQLQNSRYLMEQKERMENEKRAQDFEDYMLRRRKERPHY